MSIHSCRLDSALLATLEVVGQADRKWIVCESRLVPGRLAIVDQHAASERIRYEEFKAAMARHPVEPAAERPSWLKMERCRIPVEGGPRDRWGFKFESSCLVQAPVLFGKGLWDQLPGILKAGLQESRMPRAMDRILGDHACKGAIKFGEALSQEQMEEVVRRLSGTPQGLQCVHGRPTVHIF